MSVRAAQVLVMSAALAAAGACGSAQGAADRDPLRCERNPECSKARGSSPDCSRQCADDPECVDRCRQVRTDPGLGHN